MLSSIIGKGRWRVLQASAKNSTRPTFIPKYELAEHQANFVAAATLVDLALIENGETSESIARNFQVSLDCAEHIVQEKWPPAKDPNILAGLRRLGDSLEGKAQVGTGTTIASLSLAPRTDLANQNRPVVGTSLDVCPDCGQIHAPDPISGSKNACAKSGRAGDFYQDGDGLWDEELWPMSSEEKAIK